ncbi:MAG: hypothetical protein CSA62_02320 [Planctomycetota bacterium]|nr:MAG: hypothetical protein CSA62_02320 [Planctomycetota bacterium]
MRNTLEQRKAQGLDQLTRLYAHALEGLIENDFDQALQAVDEADPLILQLSKLESDLRAIPGEQPDGLSIKTREVKGLHQQLTSLLEEQLGAVEIERRRMKIAQRVVRGYRRNTQGQQKGRILDGTC